jgi:hypothetical protein
VKSRRTGRRGRPLIGITKGLSSSTHFAVWRSAAGITRAAARGGGPKVASGSVGYNASRTLGYFIAIPETCGADHGTACGNGTWNSS